MNGGIHADRVPPDRPARSRIGVQTQRSSGWADPANRTDGLWRLRRPLFRWLIRRGVDRDEAEDAIQDAFLRLCVAERQQRVRNAAAFLTGIVKRIRIERWHVARRR